MIYLGKQAVGNTSVVVGDFKKFEKKTLTFPNAVNGTKWNSGAVVPCSFVPKVIIFYGGNETRSSTILSGVLAFTTNDVEIGLAGVKATNSNGDTTQGGFIESESGGSSHFKYESGTVYICRLNSGSYWSDTDSYTFEIYG